MPLSILSSVNRAAVARVVYRASGGGGGGTGGFSNISVTVSSGSYPLSVDPSGNGPDVFGSAVSANNGLTYQVYTFTRPGVTYTVNYTCNDASKPIYMLAVGGGGGGASWGGGAGGAGGMIDQSFNLVAGTSSITISIGSGGPGSAAFAGAGTQGGNTTVTFNALTNKTVIAGGGAGGTGKNATSIPAPYSLFGSGGGGAGQNLGPPTNANTNETGGTYYSPLIVYANNGGSGYNGTGGPSGGGGGAGAVGTSATTNTTVPNGGNGRQTVCYGIKEFNPKGTPYGNYFWAGGGGAATSVSPVSGGGGGAGGGGGGISTSISATQGVGDKSGLNPATDASLNLTAGNGGANTGGGGGGDWNGVPAGYGGSGIVIIAFPSSSRFLVPTDVSSASLQLWLDANDPSGNGTTPTTTTLFSTIADKSGKSNTATARTTGGTTATTITWNNNTFNSLPSFAFDNTKYLSGSCSISGSTATVFAMVKMSSSSHANARPIAFSNGSSTSDYTSTNYFEIQRYNPNPASSNFQLYRNGSIAITANQNYDTPYQLEGWFNGTTGYITYDGSSNTFSGASTGTFAATYYVIGSTTNTTEQSLASLTGNISEVLVYNTVLTNSDRQKIEGYLAWKWGLNNRLPSTHPYYSAAPTVTIIQATIDTNFVDVTSNLIWWYGMQTGDISSNNIGLYNYVTQQYDASAVGFTSFSTSEYRTGSASLPMSSTQYIKFPNYSFSAATTYTVVFWAKDGNSNAFTSTFLLSQGNDYNNAYFLSYHTVSSYIYTLSGTTKNYYGYPTTMKDSTWHLVTWQVTTGSAGTVLNIDNSTNNYTANGNNFGAFTTQNNYMGYSSWDATQYILGNVDDIRLYTGSITTTQRQAIYDISNANCYFTSYSVTRDVSNMIINWSGTNIQCVTLSNKTQNLNYGRLTTSGQTYSGINWTSNDLFYLTPYNSTTVATAKAGQATRLFKIS